MECSSSSFLMMVNCGVHPAAGQGSISEGSGWAEKLAGRKHAEFNKDTCKTTSLGWAKMLINR